MVSVCKHFWGYAPIGPETMNLKLSVILMSAFAAACANAAVTDFTVNGTKVTAAQQEQILKNLTARGQQRTPQLENAVKQNLVTEIAVLQEAQKAGLANDPNVKIAVQNATNNIMTEALLNRYVQQHPTSDADLQKMYQKDKAAYGNTEYHLRQIVTKTQGEAQNALNRVLKGENFAKVASAVTIDHPSKARGGDIGWVRSGSCCSADWSAPPVPQGRSGLLEARAVPRRLGRVPGGGYASRAAFPDL